jgi:hypothetical protein
MRVLIEERETFTAGSEQAIVNYTASVINRLTLHGVNAGKHGANWQNFRRKRPKYLIGPFSLFYRLVFIQSLMY